MANPTSNFGWQMPTPTDLVTDLPADFEVFGQAVDTSLADLKGGTTGQVLAKNSGTDMDFVWVAQDDSNAIQNAIVDAKGDLIAASAADTPARLAIGANGETLVADSSASTGLRYTAGTVQGNPTLNSAFQVWQRGTSVSLSASAGTTYTADRWATASNANQALTISRQATNDSTNLPFVQYCARYQRNSGQTGTGGLGFTQSMETINSIAFAGKTVTFSFYARSGANYSATSNALVASLYTGTGTDQNILSTYTGATASVTGTATLTTTWQRFTFTATLPTTMTEMAIYFSFTPTGTAGAADYYEVTGVQIDCGSVALPFRTYAGTIQGELAACQRYFISNGQVITWQGNVTNAQLYINTVTFPVQMRVAPTITQTSYSASNFNSATLSAGTITVGGYLTNETANATASGAYYQLTYTASAEL